MQSREESIDEAQMHRIMNKFVKGAPNRNDDIRSESNLSKPEQMKE